MIRYQAWEYHARTGTVVHPREDSTTREGALARIVGVPGVVTRRGVIVAETPALPDDVRAVLLDAVRRLWVAYTPEPLRPKCARKHCPRRRASLCADTPDALVPLCLSCRTSVECATARGGSLTRAVGRPVKRNAAPRWRAA